MPPATEYYATVLSPIQSSAHRWVRTPPVRRWQHGAGRPASTGLILECRERPSGGAPFRLTRVAVTQQLARLSARALTILKGYLTVDHDPAVALRPLHPPPVIRRHVVNDLPRQNVQLVEIVDQNVRRQPFTQTAAVL